MFKCEQYGKYKIIETSNIADFSNCDIAKVLIPSSIENEIKMKNEGFFFADRTLLTSIQISKCELNLDKLIRLNVEETDLYKNEIENIAIKSFPYDRRFHNFINYNDDDIATLIIKKWVSELDKVLIAKLKDKIVGFLSLKETSPDSLFVHLAAVDEKYRLTGAAMSLYAYALKFAKKGGYKKLLGRISSKNVAVINLYAYLGAHFEEPIDIYLKEFNRGN